MLESRINRKGSVTAGGNGGVGETVGAGDEGELEGSEVGTKLGGMVGLRVEVGFAVGAGVGACDLLGMLDIEGPCEGAKLVLGIKLGS